jgi:DNA polymerase-1
MMTRLLLVDGSNIVMRAAYGGQIEPKEAARTATGMIRRASLQARASHLVIAIDSAAPSWRKQEFPDYKANRSLDTTPWIRAGQEAWARAGWMVEECAGYEADDVIATLSKRAQAVSQVTVCSGDSDVLSLTANGVEILRPVNGGVFMFMTKAEVCIKYDIPAPELLTDYKAMVGEANDGVPGVPGIGPVKAARLISQYGPLEAILSAGAERRCKDSLKVAENATVAKRAFRLVSLSFDAPIIPVKPSDCVLPREDFATEAQRH